MVYFEKCVMIYTTLDGGAYVESCNVKIDDQKIRIEYAGETDNGQRIVEYYEGVHLGHGHFKLEKTDGYGIGRTSLHLELDSKSLVGFWIEDGHEGFWKIILPEPI